MAEPSAEPFRLLCPLGETEAELIIDPPFLDLPPSSVAKVEDNDGEGGQGRAARGIATASCLRRKSFDADGGGLPGAPTKSSGL